MMKKFLFLLVVTPYLLIAQNKKITLADIYKNGTFRAAYAAPDFGKTETPVDISNLKDADGVTMNNAEVVQPQAATGWVILKRESEPIYRRSSKSFVYVYNTNNKTLLKISDGKVLHPQLSPDGNRVAYVENNNLYIYDIAAKQSKAVTTDGKWNSIINGNCDWVYEEEFEFTQAYQWNPTGDYIAYYKFDESHVKEYAFTKFDNNYNSTYSYKYPKAGEANSVVSIHLYNTRTGADTEADFEKGDIYIPRIKWAANPMHLIVFWMNRHQDDLKLLQTDAATGTSKLLYEEQNKCYVEVNDDWWFHKNNFVFTSEKDGYKQLYTYSNDGKIKTQISKGNHDIAEVLGIDEKRQLVYYTTAYPTPMDRTLFVSTLNGTKTTQLSTDQGFRSIVFNPEFTQYYEYFSTINSPQKVTLNNITVTKNGVSVSPVKTITENEKLKTVLNDYGVAKVEFIKVPNETGELINGWMLKPANFDASKKYPVLFCNYGGPGSQQVVNRFGAASMWHQMLAQKGFIIVCFDNTGTGYRGEAFKKKTYLQLGRYEIADQIAMAKWLTQQPYVDKNKIGHWGWSFGGFMSSLAITKGADVFSAALAVAPVTNWRFYDNIYTERYMRTPKENADGYDNNSPINFTSKIKGKYMIIHGTADDNVHFQNATQMVTSLVKSNIPFESAYYPNKNHGISGGADGTTLHLWTRMTRWLLDNLGNEHTDKSEL